MQDEVLCAEGLAHRDQTRGLALLAGLLRSCPQPPAPLSLQGAHLSSSPAPATSCVQMCNQFLAEPTQGICCKLPPSRSLLPYGFRAGQCCESCAPDAPVLLPPAYLFQIFSFPVSAWYCPDHPCSSGTAAFSRCHIMFQCTRPVGKLCAGAPVRCGHLRRTQEHGTAAGSPELRQTLAWFIVLRTARSHGRQMCVCPA